MKRSTGKIIKLLLTSFLIVFILYNSKIAIANESSNYEIANLDSQITIKQDGFIEVSEVVRPEFLTNDETEIVRSIPLTAPSKDQAGYEIEVRDVRVTDSRGENVVFEELKNEGYLRIRVPVSESVKNNLPLSFNFTIGGGIYYFAENDGLNAYFSKENYGADINISNITVILPQELEEKDITFSCFDKARNTGNCKASISGYRLKFELPEVKANELYTVAVRFPIGVVDITRPIKKKSFVGENFNQIVVLFLTVIIFSGIIYLAYRELSLNKKNNRKK